MNVNAIIEENKDLLERVVKYICAIKKIDKEQILAQPNVTLKSLFYYIRKENYDVLDMRKERDKMQEDLYYLERNGGVSAKQTDANVGGHDNGLRENKVLNRLLQIEQMRQDIIKKTVDIRLIEKEKNEKRKMIRDFIYILPQIQYSRILEATYFELMNDSIIADELNYEYESIRHFRLVAIKSLSNILKTYVKGIE